MTFQYHAAIIYACNNVKFLELRNTSFGGNTLCTSRLGFTVFLATSCTLELVCAFRLQINNIPVDGFDFDGMTP